VHGVFVAPLTEFAEFQALFQGFLVFVAVVTSALTIFTFKFDEILL
jgi:hypothetical protein